MWTDRRTDRQRGTDMKKVVVSFRSSANAPKTDLLLNHVLRSLTFWCNVRWSTMCKPLHNVEGIDATVVLCVWFKPSKLLCWRHPLLTCGLVWSICQEVAVRCQVCAFIACTVRIQAEGSTAKYVRYWNINSLLLRTEYRSRNLDCFYAGKCVHMFMAQ